MMYSYRIIILICIGWIAAGCGHKEHEQQNIRQTRHHASTSDRYAVKTIQVEGGWGYAIYVDSTMYVKQEHIPAIAGVVPFASEADALLVGTLAKEKLEHGLMPPTVTVEEMVNLGIVLPAQN